MIQCQTLLIFFLWCHNKTTACSLLEIVMPINMPSGCAQSGNEMKLGWGLLLSLVRHFVSCDGHHLPLTSIWERSGDGNFYCFPELEVQCQQCREVGINGEASSRWQLSGPTETQEQAKSKDPAPLDLRWEASRISGTTTGKLAVPHRAQTSWVLTSRGCKGQSKSKCRLITELL